MKRVSSLIALVIILLGAMALIAWATGGFTTPTSLNANSANVANKPDAELVEA